MSQLSSETVARRRDLTVRIHDFLRTAILSGDYAPGTELKQTKVAASFGTSRGPVREAMSKLEEEGLVESPLNYRSIVTALHPADIAIVYGSRIALEAYALALSTGRLSDWARGRAEESLIEMTDSGRDGDLARWNKAHFAFHAWITDPVGAVMNRTLNPLRARCDRFVNYYHVSNAEAPLSRMSEHYDLLSATLDVDGNRSACLLANHLAATAYELLESTDRLADLEVIEAALELHGRLSDRNDKAYIEIA